MRTLTCDVACRQSIAAVICMLGVLIASEAPLQAANRPFSVADDVALSRFGSHASYDDDPFDFSPNRQFFVVYTEHGRLELNRPESILRVYRTEDIVRVLKERPCTRGPSPVWEIRKSTYRHGPIVTRVRWLRDSSGVAFLARTASGTNQLLLADLRTRLVYKLTRDDQYVTSFDIRTRHNFVYTALALSPRKQVPNLGQSAIIGTGRDLLSLMFPEDSRSPENFDQNELWAVVGDRLIKLRDPASGRPLTTYWSGKELSLSPDGLSVVTVLPPEVVPAEWERLYPPPPLRAGSFRILAGRQDLKDPHGWFLVEEYVRIDLQTGEIQRLVDSPTARSAGWWASPSADWSPNGRSIVLSGVFVRIASPTTNTISRPCVAVIDMRSLHATCLESVYGSAGDDPLKWHYIARVRFAHSDSRVTIDSLWSGNKILSTTYTRGSNSNWRQDNSGVDERGRLLFSLSIKQSLNDPPILLATESSNGFSHIIWDPNPQLRSVTLGKVSIFRWKGRSGHDDVGGLFKPPDYIPGKRYPLVIQTHGFAEDEFIPNGGYPTAFAAQELAAHGIMVLQVRGQACPEDTTNTPEEAPCAAANYEAAANELIKAGMADPEKLGIIGFSRTGYYVLEELTAGAVHFKAAAITDSVDYGYLQYIENLDFRALRRNL